MRVLAALASALALALTVQAGSIHLTGDDFEENVLSESLRLEIKANINRSTSNHREQLNCFLFDPVLADGEAWMVKFYAPWW